MCTAISTCGERHLFGRTLDLEISYGESVILAPRRYGLTFRHESPAKEHAALLGIGIAKDGVPLYYDAVNEHGLCAAALNFPKNAVYRPYREGQRNLASFEVIPYVLSHCRTVAEAENISRGTNITDDAFSAEMQPSPLHWIFADEDRCITLESVEDGMHLYENRFGVLTNNPPFPYHELRLTDFMGIGDAPPENRLCPKIELAHYSRGAGGIGLPGDFSSSARFIRAVFAKNHTTHGTDESEITRFFHMTDTVSIPNGCVKTDSGDCVRTVYTSCADTSARVYYFTTHDCRRIRAVRMTEELADKEILSVFPMEDGEDIEVMNS